jgi:hypothetical protein
MDISKGILAPCHIKIGIFPVGNIDASSFKFYASLIQNFSKIPIKNLSRFKQDNLKSFNFFYFKTQVLLRIIHGLTLIYFLNSLME